jgi:putative tryptophan/tyrosine transport system substrate-binding protein
MRRREFIALVGAAALAWPHGLRAQQPASLGYEDGRTMHLVIRSADSKLDRLPELAAELVKMKADVIVAINTPPTRAAINATKEIPIVMAILGNPLATGFVNNLARPGGNVTGISNLSGELASKRLEILKEALPAAKRVAVLFNSDDPVTAPQVRDTDLAARKVGVEVKFLVVRSRSTLSSAFKELTCASPHSTTYSTAWRTLSHELRKDAAVSCQDSFRAQCAKNSM